MSIIVKGDTEVAVVWMLTVITLRFCLRTYTSHVDTVSVLKPMDLLSVLTRVIHGDVARGFHPVLLLTRRVRSMRDDERS